MTLLEKVGRLVEDDADADDVLRAVVGALVENGAAWSGILFVEDDELVLGPQAGTPAPSERTVVPVLYEGTHVADLAADRYEDRETLSRVADLVAIQCLVGWDTGGVPWDDAEA